MLFRVLYVYQLTMRRVCALFFMGILFPLFSFGQQSDIQEAPGSATTSDVFYKYSIQGGTDIMYALTDPAFVRDFTNGIYAFNAAIDESITKRLYAGIEVYDNEFGNAFPRYSSVSPRMFLYMGGARIGYRSSLTNNLLFNATLTGGEGLVQFTGAPIDPPKVKSVFGSLRVMEAFRLNEQFWIGLHISYTYMPYTYNPFDIGIGNSFPYLPSDYHGPLTFLGWGFQAFFLFSKK